MIDLVCFCVCMRVSYQLNQFWKIYSHNLTSYQLSVLMFFQPVHRVDVNLHPFTAFYSFELQVLLEFCVCIIIMPK